MPLDPAQYERLREAITKKTPMGGTCSMCGTNSWTVEPGLVMLSIQLERGSAVVLGGPSLPSVPIVCNQCGNTMLLNVFRLGVADLFGLAAIGDQPPPAPAPIPAAPPPLTDAANKT